MSRRHQITASSSRSQEEVPLLEGDDTLLYSGSTTPKKDASVDVLAVGADEEVAHSTLSNLSCIGSLSDVAYV